MRWRFLLLIFGLTLILFGGHEIALWRVARDKPQTMTCEQLGRDGPGDNAHIALERFLLLVNAFVYEERGGRWTVAWVPALPAGGGAPAEGPAGEAPERDVRVLIKMPRARSMADVVHTSQQPQLVGMVVDEIEELGPAEQATLERHYPGVDFDRVHIFELGRKPAGIAQIVASVVVGSALILFMLWTLLGGQTPRTPAPHRPAAGTGLPVPARVQSRAP